MAVGATKSNDQSDWIYLPSTFGKEKTCNELDQPPSSDHDIVGVTIYAMLKRGHGASYRTFNLCSNNIKIQIQYHVIGIWK